MADLKDLETNSQLQEIFDILLLAGYFRVRIPSISPFDKILGGLAWCISCSNFEIDIEYNDEMKLGEKLTLAQKVVSSLQKMNYPHMLSPHQIQGLDLPQLYPVFKFLIQFVLETRQYRQDYNKNISNYFGEKLLRKGREVKNISKSKNDKRITKNTSSSNFGKDDPIKVYSTLLEFDDKTAFFPFHKMSEVDPTKSQADNKLNRKTSIAKKDERRTSTTVLKGFKKEDGAFSNVNLEALGIISDSKEEEMEFGKIIEKQQQNFARIERRQSKLGENLYKIVIENKDKIAEDIKNYEEEEGEELEFATLIKNEKELHEQEVSLISNKIHQIDNKLESEVAVIEQLFTKEKENDEKTGQFKGLIEELNETISIINEKLKEAKQKKSEKEFQEIEILLQKKEELKTKKINMKKEAKQEMEAIELEKQRLSEENGEIDENLVSKTEAVYKNKKNKFDEKYKDLARINQEIAVLQRKLESFPSAIEIAQYHQRFIELFERINTEMEKSRDSYAKYNNLQDLRTIIMQNNDVMKSFKEGFENAKSSKSKKEDFLKNLQEAYKGIQTNFLKSNELVEKAKLQKEKNYAKNLELIKTEREYYKIIKDLQIELERNDELIARLNIE